MLTRFSHGQWTPSWPLTSKTGVILFSCWLCVQNFGEVLHTYLVCVALTRRQTHTHRWMHTMHTLHRCIVSLLYPFWNFVMRGGCSSFLAEKLVRQSVMLNTIYWNIWIHVHVLLFNFWTISETRIHTTKGTDALKNWKRRCLLQTQEMVKQDKLEAQVSLYRSPDIN